MSEVTKVRRVHVTLELQVKVDQNPPEDWDWFTLLDLDGTESVMVLNSDVEEEFEVDEDGEPIKKEDAE